MAAIAAEFFTTNRIVGDVLREIREDAGWTLHDVSCETDGRVKGGALSAWERGDRTVTVERLLDLARVYSVPPGVLMSVIERRCQR